jgi:hypothetical protein
MISPAGFTGRVFTNWNAQTQKNLFALDPLFSKSFIVQASRRSPKAGQR